MSNDNWFGVEPPRDATGKAIPLDTETLYTTNGQVFQVGQFRYLVRANQWLAYGHYEYELKSWFDIASRFMLTVPDSWEKLEEDLDRCIEENDSCVYYSPRGSCNTCAKPDNETCECTAAVFKSIKERIRKLAKKEGE